MELPVCFRDGKLIDARMPCVHQPLAVEFPILVSVSTEPGPRIIVIFVCKAHRDAIAMECPQLLDEPVVQFSRPLSPEKSDDLIPAGREFGTISPSRIHTVSQRDLLGVTRIPAIFGEAHLENCGFLRKGRQWRTWSHNKSTFQERRKNSHLD